MYFWHSDKARNGSRLARAKAGLAAAGRAGAKGYVKKKAKKTVALLMAVFSSSLAKKLSCSRRGSGDSAEERPSQ